MEYKIGQRVKHEGDEWYFQGVNNNGEVLAINGDNKLWCDISTLFPLYKTGDKVRVTATEEELANIALDDVVAEGSIIEIYLVSSKTLYFNQKWVIPIGYVEWHSGAEDKPEYYDTDDLEMRLGIHRKDCNLEYPNGHELRYKNGRDYDSYHASKHHGVILNTRYHRGDVRRYGAVGVADKPVDHEGLKQFLDSCAGIDPDILVAEVHQDKERNKAVLAEVLDYNGLPLKKWRCPNHTSTAGCKFTGTMEQLEGHMRKAHPGEYMPPKSSPVWIKWQVS